MQEGGRRVGIYCRISRDDGGERLGVQRQEEDGRQDCDRRQWEVVRVYVDNDVSGSGKVRRAEYDDLVRDLRDGLIDTVWAADLDRLHRGFTEYVELYRICETRKAWVVWLGGLADFATGRGMLEMEMRATFAREELRKIKQRNKRKHLELLMNGKSAGGPRPFGYDRVEGVPGWTIILEDEAAMVREAARRVLAGESMGSVCRDWNERGIRPQRVEDWQVRSLRQILVSARISGRRERRLQADGRSHQIGQIFSTANWPAIISTEDSDRLRNIFSANLRVGRPPSNLLAGIARCGYEDCGARLRHDHHPRFSMSCDMAPGKEGCGRIRVVAGPVEAMVTEAVLRLIERNGGIARHMQGDDGGRLVDELKAIDDQLTAWSHAVGEGRLLAVEWEGLRAGVVKRRAAIERELAKIRRPYDLEGLPDPLRPEWPTLAMPRKRAVIKQYVEAVVIKPNKRRGGPFDEDRVSILWRA